jgi:hypothetical protein
MLAGFETGCGSMNVDYAATQFFSSAINSERDNPGFAAWQVANDVQNPCCPLRYRDAEGKARQLMAEAAPAVRHNGDGSDIDGDGAADLLGGKADGTLWYYPNNRASNPGGLPFAGSGMQIGSGFDNFTKLT